MTFEQRPGGCEIWREGASRKREEQCKGSQGGDTFAVKDTPCGWGAVSRGKLRAEVRFGVGKGRQGFMSQSRVWTLSMPGEFTETATQGVPWK